MLLRALCWELEIVSDAAFQRCLPAIRPLRSRLIQALLPTYLRLWRAGSDPEPELSRILREDLAALQRPRGLIARWRESPEQLLGPSAHEAFASAALHLRSSTRDRLERFNLATDTEFARSVASRLLDEATEAFKPDDSLDWLFGYLLPHDSPIAGKKGWGSALQNLILNQEVTRDERVRERILDFALRDLRLGDPRVSRVPWHPVGDDATNEVIRWRSSEDLRFFFDLVMKGKPDYQGRHRFWKKYVDGVTRSLIVLSENDEHRLQRRLRDFEKRGRRFVRMTGTNLTSAFVMEFGDTVIVEFSEAGNACFIYREPKGKDPIPWQDSEVGVRVLKNPKRAKERFDSQPTLGT